MHTALLVYVQRLSDEVWCAGWLTGSELTTWDWVLAAPPWRSWPRIGVRVGERIRHRGAVVALGAGWRFWVRRQKNRSSFRSKSGWICTGTNLNSTEDSHLACI